MQNTLNKMLPPVTVPRTEKNIARSAPASKVRTRHANEPFSSTHEIASAVRVIHAASSILPVANPQMTGNVPDKAMRSPQLISGSKL